MADKVPMTPDTVTTPRTATPGPWTAAAITHRIFRQLGFLWNPQTACTPLRMPQMKQHDSSFLTQEAANNTNSNIGKF